ncbi:MULTISPECIES: carboxypeptidase-like regulatory domain-containing protein [unclassified Pseudomonas]|uniref:carboxypeptidase-like regulatory domain-containing protein n=1 Tax=unclassified Pseudomonas TaxID=196821 RepID=UPI00111348BC|nr:MULTISPECIES: carboxypeptidase-like regulatory domain-containing protein [unclassified Pseudomonas]
MREPWQADSFIHRHFAGADQIHRLRALLSAQESLVHLLDDREVRRQVASKLWCGELCAYVYPYQRPMPVRVPASVAVEEVVAPVSAAARRRLPVKASSESASRPEPVVLTFVEIELLDMQGQPVAGESYVIALPNGTQHSGVLDAFGRARVDGLDPGNCQVTFPELDQRAVERWKGS